MIALLYACLSIIPLRARILTGRTLGFIFGLFPSREKKIACAQMQISLKGKFSLSMPTKVFSNIGQTVMECMNLKPYLDDIDKYITAENWELAETLKAQGRSLVVLTAHTSNWDLLAAYAIKKGFKVATIARQARNPALQELLKKIRESYGIHTIWRDDPKSTKEIIRCLKSNSVLAALIDQDVEAESIHVPFFGMPAKYPSGLIHLGKKNGSEFVAAFIFREGIYRYKIYLHRLDVQADIPNILSEYSRLLEGYISKYPDQWVWFHKRWRSLESGKKLSGKEYLNYLQNYENLDKVS